MFALTLKDINGNQVWHGKVGTKKQISSVLGNKKFNQMVRAISFSIHSTYSSRLLLDGQIPATLAERKEIEAKF